jgi:hypothetical protein
VFYAIEKQDSEWVIYVHGAAILRCAESDIALEIVRAAQSLLGNQALDHALLGETLPPVRCRESGA